MTRLRHWQDAVNAVLGAWLVLSPWAMGYLGEASAMANAIVIGVALTAAALGAIFRDMTTLPPRGLDPRGDLS